MFRCFCVILALINIATLVQGKCEPCQGIHGYVPTSVYDDLRCTAVHDSAVDEHCPVKYDCSHIYNRPNDTCHFQGKSYKIGEFIDNEELSGVWDSDCSCTDSLKFDCPKDSDGCAEDWVGGYPKPTCYLRRELHSYCANGQICPPFDGNAKCEVKGVMYREGDTFTHPHEQCVQCVCDKGFNGTLEKPFCQPVNCTVELHHQCWILPITVHHSKAIDDYCAPYYDYKDDPCCPKTWVCPSEDGIFTPYAPNPVGTPRNQPASEYFCKFGKQIMHIGDYYEHEDKELGYVYCQCNIPPFVDCKKLPERIILTK